jgi:hypothetical protein
MVISAIDNTGLIVGPIGHGVGFADASAPESSAAEDNAQLNLSTPDTGPVSGGAAITANVAFSPPYALSQFYVGNSLISDATMSSSGEVNATAPAASGGMAVDLTALSADGTVALVPEGYSYGPTIVELVPNAATSDGGQQGAVVGYGFGNSASAIQVSIGGRSAAVNHLYDYAPISPYPFPIETLTFTIPPGTAGVSTVSITSPSGTTTGTFTYAPKAISYPVNATLQQGIYDSHRNLYFFSDTTTIQVLSPSSGTWQTPITLPGTSGASQLIGIAESPDGSTLAVADNGGQAIYVLDPDNPSSAKRYPVPAASNAPYPYPPLALVVLDNKSVYYVAKYRFGSSSADFLKLDLTTGQFKDFQIYGQEASIDQYDRVLASPDQSRVYSDLSGSEFWVDTTTDTLHRASGTAAHESLGTVDGAISADGSTISVNGYLTDDLLNPETLAVYIDWETWLPTASYGQKLNRDGSILYQPLTDGVDLIERNTGRLLYRVQVPGTLASVYDPMFLGASAGTLGYFTTAGVTFIDVSSLSIPAGAPTPFPGSSSADKTRIAVDGRVAKPLLRSRTDRPALTYSGDATRPARY